MTADPVRLQEDADGSLICGFCGQVPEEHSDSDHGPMSVCPARIDGSLRPPDPHKTS